jgi:predicted DNA-binding transcriptional regulator YafY
LINGYLEPVRASRLVGLLGLLQARGRMTTGQLAIQLEVSQRTILRDIEALSAAGIPVFAVRGRQGGFQLVDGFVSDLPAAGYLATRPQPGPGVLRARVRLSPRGRRLAALLGRPAGVRVRRNARPAAGREDWVEAWVRADSVAAAVVELLALGAEVEVLHPPQLRAQLYQTARQIAALHAGDGPPRPARPHAAISGGGATPLQPLSDPELDDGLAGNP